MIRLLSSFILFALLEQPLFATSEKLDFYSCPSIESGKTCSQNCNKVGNISFDVRVKTREGNVNVTVFTENEIAPGTLKNCNVTDLNNWSCETIEVFQEQTHSMKDGIYFSEKVFRMLDGEDDISIFCAR